MKPKVGIKSWCQAASDPLPTHSTELKGVEVQDAIVPPHSASLI